MNDAVSTADDRLALVLALAESDLESATTAVQTTDWSWYRLRARTLTSGVGDSSDPVVHVEESADAGHNPDRIRSGDTDADDVEWLSIVEYDRAAIDDLAMAHRRQVRELHVRQEHPQSHHPKRREARARQRVRNRKALQERFRDARLTSWTRTERVVAHV